MSPRLFSNNLQVLFVFLNNFTLVMIDIDILFALDCKRQCFPCVCLLDAITSAIVCVSQKHAPDWT